MLNIVVIDDRAQLYRDLLEERFPGKLNVLCAASNALAVKFAPQAEVLLCPPYLPKELIKNAKCLKWIQALSTGTNHIIESPLVGEDMLITSLKGIHGPQMAETALLHMLALNRRFSETLRNQKAHVWKRWHLPLLREKKLGIVGMGTTGQAIAVAARAFGLEIHALVENPRAIPEADVVHPAAELLNLAETFDFLVLVTPLSEKTRHMVNATLLKAMKPSAFLINMGRGGLVDDDALVDALNRKEIAGAALDTFVVEPLPAESPYWDMENVLITPHLGGSSENYPQQGMEIIGQNIEHYLAGNIRGMRNLVRHP